jgi:tRNA (adenine57-N1/adenine58-N1)-methyltransferase
VVTGYELREDFADVARQNVSELLGTDALTRYEVLIRNAYEGIEHTGFDRVVLDLPEPWQVIPHLEGSLKSGGIIVTYSPSIMQVTQTRRALDNGPYAMIESVEVLHRTWHIDGYSVRPDHRMVAHTGFLTHARMLG